jgi:hypothetical protein
MSKEHHTMTRIRMVGLALSAVFAVMIIASASALAAENPVLVNKSGAAFNGTVTSEQVTGTEPTLQTTATGAAQIECTTEKDKATFTTTKTGTGMTTGVAKVTFTGCKIPVTGKCENTATTGEITGTVSTLLVWIKKESEKKPGILISILPYTGAGRGLNALLSFTCATQLVDVEGSFIAKSSREALNEKFTTATLIAKSSSGKQELTEYTENGTEGTNTLFSNQNKGPFAKAGEGIESAETYSEEVEIAEN